MSFRSRLTACRAWFPPWPPKDTSCAQARDERRWRFQHRSVPQEGAGNACAAGGSAPAPCFACSGRRRDRRCVAATGAPRSEEHTSELQSLMRISYAVFCLKKKNTQHISKHTYFINVKLAHQLTQ